MLAFALFVAMGAGEQQRILAYVDESFTAVDGPAGGLTRVKRVTPPPKRERSAKRTPPKE
jgi:hypothetical protein